MIDTEEDNQGVWRCYHCNSTNISIFWGQVICNDCLRVTTVSAISDDLQEK